MIQDIFPKHLDNQYKPEKPAGQDRVFFFRGMSILGRTLENRLDYPHYAEFENAEGSYSYIYLFAVDSERFFLALDRDELQRGSFQGESADSDSHPEYPALLPGYAFIGINVFRKARPKAVSFAAITAFHLYGWYRDNRFCGRCGRLMRHDERERMLRCACCHNMVYPKISPAVIVAVTDKDRLLLTKYAGRAYQNYALIAGFTEIGESIEQTVEREVFEEVGLHVKNIRYYKSQPWALSQTLLSGFFCELDGSDRIRLQEEELAVGEWVHAAALPAEDDGISLTQEMICKFRSEHVCEPSADHAKKPRFVGV